MVAVDEIGRQANLCNTITSLRSLGGGGGLLVEPHQFDLMFQRSGGSIFEEIGNREKKI